ncbi:MAG: hypothetical protein K5848_07860 [Lachnospiraceae bacterium]|nr:hypothetical protein [Lachnospiraceae bacterium]
MLMEFDAVVLSCINEEDELLECEKAANEAIAADLPISISYPESDISGISVERHMASRY